MAYAVKLLNPIRKSFSSITFFYSSSQISGRQPFSAKFELIRTWMKQLDPTIHNQYSKFRSKWNIQTQYIRSRLSIRGLLVVPCIIGYIGFSQRLSYAMDGQDIWMDDRDLLDASDEERDTPLLWIFVRKLWLPAFFFLTVLVNWDRPYILVTKVVLFLLSTKPSPLSVYVFVEQLCHQSMRQQPYSYLLKSLYANKVEVQDYKLFCLATIEVKNQKLTLVGVLGGWWALPLSQGAFSVFCDSVFY